jgi:diguanylate cyclase (GGDEF)-like protein
MGDLKNADWEGLAMRVNALQSMQGVLERETPGAVDTLRRISRSIGLSDSASRYPEINTLAKTLTEAPDKKVGTTLLKVLPRLQMLASNPPAQTHRVLVVEDDRTTTQILRQRLGALHQHVIATGTLAEAEKALAKKDISFVLLDLQLPDGDGRELLLKLRSRPDTSALPIFVVSSERGSQVQTECFALGADAFFQKPFDPLTLSTAVASRLQRSADVELRASLDPLTGLANRAAFSNAFDREVLLSSRSNESLSIALLDVDRFKSVNDLYGHAMGDRVLRRFAAVIARSLRESDYLGRWGGEEFAVFFPNTDIKEACLALQKARRSLRSESFTTREGRSFKITFSAGVVKAKPGVRADRALLHADRFLYLAKAAGRDRVVSESHKVSLKKTVLMVEDDDITAAVIKRYLNQDGFNVIRAKKGEAAVAAMTPSVALVTLDVKMPGLDGFSWLERFRKIPLMRHVPIIMVTSAGREEDILRGFQLGADDYIVKPFPPNEFLARIHRFLEKV